MAEAEEGGGHAMNLLHSLFCLSDPGVIGKVR